jgi:anaerobic selenocysteine-containing dehydrogenase
VAFADRVFPTPSGRIELESADAAGRWGVDSLPDFRESAESLRSEVADLRAYPLHLLTPNTKNRIHSQFNNLAMIRALGDRAILDLHPDDAAERGIADGDPVRVFNARGSLRLAARLDNGLKRGCVCVTNGWWFSEGGTVNLLSAGRETDMGHGAAFHDNRVEVRRAE